jgi:hypothetical protein
MDRRPKSLPTNDGLPELRYQSLLGSGEISVQWGDPPRKPRDPRTQDTKRAA